MAKGVINLQKESGGIVKISPVDGTGVTEVTVPESGELATKEYADTKQSKSELAYNANTSSYIPNTLASGTIIERGSNANGEYIKFADGTMICYTIARPSGLVNLPSGNIFETGPLGPYNWPAVFSETPGTVVGSSIVQEYLWIGSLGTSSLTYVRVYSTESRASSYMFTVTGIGRWK